MMQEQPGARVTSRRQETRRRLTSVAYQAFAESGIRDTPIEVICERAGFSRGAFYSNFASKEALFLALYEEEQERRLTRLREAIARAAELADGRQPVRMQMDEAIRRIAAAFSAHFATDMTWCRLVTEFEVHSLGQPEVRQAIAEARRRLHASLEELLLAWLERTQLRPVVPPADVVLTIVAVYELALRQALLAGTAPGFAEQGLGTVLPRLVGALIEPQP